MTQANSLNPMESIHRVSPAGHKIQFEILSLLSPLNCSVTYLDICVHVHLWQYVSICVHLSVVTCRRD